MHEILVAASWILVFVWWSFLDSRDEAKRQAETQKLEKQIKDLKDEQERQERLRLERESWS